MRSRSRYQIINEVLSFPPHVDIFYHRNEIPTPISMGFEESIGEPVGQLSDHRFPLEDGRSVHLKTYEKWIGIHWDKVHPNTIENCFEHLRRDSPLWHTALCALTGAGMGALAAAPSKKKDIIIKTSIICGFLGLLAGLVTAEWE